MKENNPTLFVGAVNVQDNTKENVEFNQKQRSSKFIHRIDDLKSIYFYNKYKNFTIYTKNDIYEGNIESITNDLLIINVNNISTNIPVDSIIDFKIKIN